MQQQTFRAVRRHYKEKHSVNNFVLALRCNEPDCEWFCWKTLCCFNNDCDDDILVVDDSDYDTILVEPTYECIKVEDDSDEEIEITNTVSVKENTLSQVSTSRKRKENSFVTDVRAKNPRGN